MTKSLVILLMPVLSNCIKFFNIKKSMNKVSSFEKEREKELLKNNLSLIRASKKGLIKDVEKALIKGAYINYIDSEGKTALLYALNNKSIVKILLEKGANINIRDNKGDTLLIYAIKMAFNNKFIKFLLKKGANIDLQNNNGNTALMIAVIYSKNSTVRLLLEGGADPNIPNIHGNTPLMKVESNENSKASSYKLTKLLIRAGTNINLRNNEGDTALTIFSREKIELFSSLFKAKLLLRNNANVNTQNNNGDTALILAIKATNLKLVKLLLKFDANILIENKLGVNALEIALKKINRLLIKYYSKLNYETHIQCEFKKKIRMFEQLLKSAHYNKTNLSMLPKKIDIIFENVSFFETLIENLVDKNIFINVLLYKNNILNIENTLYFFTKFINFREELKNEIVKQIDTDKIFFYDSFLFKNKTLIIQSFFKISKLNKLEEVSEFKILNEILLRSLIEYYNEKINKTEGYEERFLEKLKIIKNKINIIIGDFYMKSYRK